MPQKEVLMTYEGLKKLEEELEYLKTTKRKEISERIKVALGYGDLSENTEYDEEKNEQAQVEMKIMDLKNPSFFSPDSNSMVSSIFSLFKFSNSLLYCIVFPLLKYNFDVYYATTHSFFLLKKELPQNLW